MTKTLDVETWQEIGSTSIVLDSQNPEASGIFAGIEERADNARPGTNLKILILETVTGRYAIRVNTLLESKIGGLKLGDRIRIVFTGNLPAKEGKLPAKTYNVFKAS